LTGRLPSSCLDQLFRDARTHNAWRDQDVSEALLHKLVDLVKLGLTSANCSPARFLFVKSRDAKERLKPHLSEGNRDKTMKSPVCTIIGYDLDFYRHLPKLFPHTDAKKAGSRVARKRSRKPPSATAPARRLSDHGGACAGARLRADVRLRQSRRRSGILRRTNIKSNFLCSLGHGDPSVLFARSPRFDFDEMARII
jgi:3-hydroxypropanoate dehydrogenase